MSDHFNDSLPYMRSFIAPQIKSIEFIEINKDECYKKMIECVEREEYEEAAIWRDRLNNII